MYYLFIDNNLICEIIIQKEIILRTIVLSILQLKFQIWRHCLYEQIIPSFPYQYFFFVFAMQLRLILGNSDLISMINYRFCEIHLFVREPTNVWFVYYENFNSHEHKFLNLLSISLIYKRIWFTNKHSTTYYIKHMAAVHNW